MNIHIDPLLHSVPKWGLKFQRCVPANGNAKLMDPSMFQKIRISLLELLFIPRSFLNRHQQLIKIHATDYAKYDENSKNSVPNWGLKFQRCVPQSFKKKEYRLVTKIHATKYDENSSTNSFELF